MLCKSTSVLNGWCLFQLLVSALTPIFCCGSLPGHIRLVAVTSETKADVVTRARSFVLSCPNAASYTCASSPFLFSRRKDVQTYSGKEKEERKSRAFLSRKPTACRNVSCLYCLFHAGARTNVAPGAYIRSLIQTYDNVLKMNRRRHTRQYRT